MIWSEMKLGDAITNRDGRYKPNDPVVAKLKRIDKINFSGEIFLSDKSSNTDMILIKKGDLVISGINVEKGAIAVYEGDEDISATIHYSSYIFNKEKINIEFLKLFLKSPDFIQLLKEQVPGGIKTEIKPKHLLPLVVKFPISTEDQAVVAEQFREKEKKYIKLVENLIFQDKKLNELSYAILSESFAGKLVKQDPREGSAQALLDKIHAEQSAIKNRKKTFPKIENSELPYQIPESWRWCRFGEFVKMSRGRFSIRPRNDKSCFGGEHPFIQIGSLDLNGSTISRHPQTLNEKGLKASKKFPTNTIAVAIVGGTIGNLGVLGYEMCFPDSIIGIIPDENYDQDFILNYMRFVQPAIKKAAYQMAGQPNIKMPTLANLLMPLPPLKEQSRIAAEIRCQLEKIESLKREVIANKDENFKLFKALLHQIFIQPNLGDSYSNEQIVKESSHKVFVLAAEIVFQLHKQPTFGHLKLQKLIYLCQKAAAMKLPTNFLRQAMGPYDPALMRSLDSALKENQWFEYQGGESLKYKPLNKAGQHKSEFNKYFENEITEIQFLIDNFKTLKSEVIEIVATLYSCLETILDETVIYSEALLLQRFYAWSEEKEKFSEKQVKRVFQRMIEIGLVPKKFKVKS